MRQILQAAGVDQVRLNMIKGVVDTCRDCRAWQRPGNTVLPSTTISTKFCEHGEVDLMFYKRKVVFHIIDRAIRYAEGMEIPDKTEASLLAAYTSTWFQRHGPF